MSGHERGSEPSQPIAARALFPLLIAALFVTEAISAPASLPGLAGEWLFEENTGLAAGDTSSNDNQGTLVNGPTWTVGHEGSGIAFDGVNDHVSVPSHSSLTSFTEITLAAWVHPTANGQTYSSCIICKPRGSNEDYALMQTSANLILWRLRVNGTEHYVSASAASLPLHTWTHVVGAWKSGSKPRIYVNGALAHEHATAISGTLDDNGSPLGFGANVDSPDNRRFQGTLDGLRLFGRMLDASEVSLLYTGDEPPAEDEDPPTSPTSMTSVPRYGVFEATILNPSYTGNPGVDPFDFSEIELRATFTSPTGVETDFFGFYDGNGAGGQVGNVWKLRFMPDQIGPWSYTYSWTGTGPHPSGGGSGAFQAFASNIPGPLRIDPNNSRWLVHDNGEHFYPKGYYFSEVFFAREDLWEPLLDTFFSPAGAYGFNFNSTTFWQAPLLAQYGWNAIAYGDHSHRSDGIFYPAYQNKVTQLDLEAWRHVDEVVAAMAAHRTVWYNFDGFIPNVGGDFVKNADWETELKVMIKNWVARLAPYWNVTWNVAFEWHEFMGNNDVNDVGGYVMTLDPWDHLATVHDIKTTDPPGTTEVENYWYSFYTIQDEAGTAGTSASANASSLMPGDHPAYAQEVVWEGIDKLNGAQVRKGAWGVVTAAGLMNYAEQFESSSGTSAYGDGAGFPYLAILNDFMDTVEYWDMHPRNDLTNGGSLMLADPGDEYVAYNESGTQVRVDLASASGTFAAEWINPRQAGAPLSAGTVAGGAVRFFTKPSTEDWVLHVRRVGLARVPDGTFGAPMRASRLASNGSVIALQWDTSTCSAQGYILLHGALANVKSLIAAGAKCGLGTTGTSTWQAVPSNNLWFLIVAVDGNGTEGSWGLNSAGAERGGTVPSWKCGSTSRDNSGTCP